MLLVENIELTDYFRTTRNLLSCLNKEKIRSNIAVPLMLLQRITIFFVISPTTWHRTKSIFFDALGTALNECRCPTRLGQTLSPEQRNIYRRNKVVLSLWILYNIDKLMIHMRYSHLKKKTTTY